MKELILSFMQAVVGQEAAQALAKAAERSPALKTALLPRTCLSWLTLTSRWGYEGQIPGIEDSYLEFRKTSPDTFDGVVTIGPDTYEFKDASILHLAAATSVALGADEQDVDPSLKQVDVARLGKNIDILVQARFINLLKKQQENSSHRPEETSVEETSEESVDKGEGRTGQAAGALEPKPPMAPNPQQKAPAMPKGNKPLKVTKHQADRECGVCGDRQFSGGRFQGCFCVRDLARFTKSTPLERGGYIVQFGPEWHPDDIMVLIDMMGA
jgi:hypothetical protein